MLHQSGCLPRCWRWPHHISSRCWHWPHHITSRCWRWPHHITSWCWRWPHHFSTFLSRSTSYFSKCWRWPHYFSKWCWRWPHQLRPSGLITRLTTSPNRITWCWRWPHLPERCWRWPHHSTHQPSLHWRRHPSTKQHTSNLDANCRICLGPAFAANLSS